VKVRVWLVLVLAAVGVATASHRAAAATQMDVAIPIVGSPRVTNYDKLLWRTEGQAILDDPAHHYGHYQSPPDLPNLNLIHIMNVFTPGYCVAHTSRAAFEKFFEETVSASNTRFDANELKINFTLE
jgi:homoserine acetyltransferase